MSKEDLLAMKSAIEEKIKKRADTDIDVSASASVSQTFNHDILAKKLQAVNYALKKLN